MRIYLLQLQHFSLITLMPGNLFQPVQWKLSGCTAYKVFLYRNILPVLIRPKAISFLFTHIHGNEWTLQWKKAFILKGSLSLNFILFYFMLFLFFSQSSILILKHNSLSTQNFRNTCRYALKKCYCLKHLGSVVICVNWKLKQVQYSICCSYC